MVARLGALRAALRLGRAPSWRRSWRPKGMVLTPRTIDRFIQREGWTRPDAAPAPALRRFAQRPPMSCGKWMRRGLSARGGGGVTRSACLDDHSRFAVGLTPLLRRCRRRACARPYSQLRALRRAGCDAHGPWRAVVEPAVARGPDRLGVFLLKQGIRLIFSAVRHPADAGQSRAVSSHVPSAYGGAACPTRSRASPQALAAFQGIQRGPGACGAWARAARRSTSRQSPSVPPGRAPGSIRPTWPIRRVAPRGRDPGGRAPAISSLRPSRAKRSPASRSTDWILVLYRHMFVRELHPRRGPVSRCCSPSTRLADGGHPHVLTMS